MGVVTIMAIVSVLFCTNAMAAAEEGHAVQEDVAESTAIEQIKVEGLKFGLIAASVAFGLGAVGAGLAISHVGAAAMAAVAEKPQIAGQALIFVALAEGIVVFGFITALMILGKV
jgi:V/A-type H+-transporting ATPase subunit K